jgi:hypothetical protein
MNCLCGVLLCFAISAISSVGGTVQQLPALPNRAVAQALQVDAAGNIYVARSLPPKVPRSTADNTDAFVAKLSADGSKFFCFIVLAGSGADAASALAGAEPSCNGQDGPQALAKALNADGSVNSAGNPAAAGSTVTIFLNGVASGAALTGLANDSPVTFQAGSRLGSSVGALPVSFQIPQSYSNGVTLSQLQAGGVGVRETFVAICVTPTPSN